MTSVTNPIRVIIADDRPLIRSGLKAFLMIYDELQLVGEAQDGDEVLQLCELVEPDVVILDEDMPGVDGFTAASIINDRWPRTVIILLVESDNPELLKQAQDSGAQAVLSKDMCPDDLIETVRQFKRFDYNQNTSRTADKGKPKITSAQGKDSHTNEDRSSLMQELEAAGKMQADILPATPPSLKGWEVAARLEPARETSGDFFDFIPLSNGNLGIVIADVTDKGMGAALFMALSSTLLRTYATQYPTLPGIVMSTVNSRILADTRGDMFVTAFYGVIEPVTGRMRYVNAGHNPPLLLSGKKGKPVDRLRPTGMALGVMENTHWGQKVARFSPGDMLLLYTDGVTDAQNPQGRFFGEQRLQQIARTRPGKTAQEILLNLLTEIQYFTGGAPPYDDIALMVISRK